MEIIKKYRWFISLACLIGLGAGVASALITPVVYDSSLSISINRINKQDTSDYTYDGYYSIQASDLFSQTVMSWFLTPSVLLEIYTRAGIDPQITSLEEIASRFKTKQYAPQNIVVRYKERSYETAEKIALAVSDVVKEKAAKANQNNDATSLFEVESATPVIVEKKPVLWLDALLGLLAGMIVSLAASYFAEYLRDEQIK